MSVKVGKNAKLSIGGKVIENLGDVTIHIDTVGSRWRSSGPNIQNLPRDEFKGVNYAELETRIIAMMYPGADGVGADLLPDFLQGQEQPTMSGMIYSSILPPGRHQRAVGMSPALGAPYGANPALSLDILKTDDVIYARTHRAKVKRFDANKDSVEIEFNDKNLIPPTMWVPMKDVQYAYGGAVVNPQTHCPNCNVRWKEIVLARFSVFDCPCCGAKKEDHAP